MTNETQNTLQTLLVKIHGIVDVSGTAAEHEQQHGISAALWAACDLLKDAQALLDGSEAQHDAGGEGLSNLWRPSR